METFIGIEWRIENVRHWCPEVHGDCIQSPEFSIPYILRLCGERSTYLIFMQLYPKGISGQGEHIVVRLCGLGYPFSGELSFCSRDGSLICAKQPVNAEEGIENLVLPPGPKFEDVLDGIWRGDMDFTVALRIKNCVYSNFEDQRARTTINAFEISLEVNPMWIEEMESDETRDLFYIQLSPKDNLCRMWLKICSKNNLVHFMIEPPTEYKDRFAVETCVSWKGSDANATHFFRDNSPWTFPDPLEKGELHGTIISLLFCLKTKDSIQNQFYMICASSCVSIESNNKICFPDKTHNSATVLAKDLMCLYQNQNFSDVSLKCDNVTFPVHKVILSARSPVFKTMLSTEMKEATSGEVVIGDLHPSTLALFLTYLYTGAVEEVLQWDRALELYYVADKYQVPSLKRECSKFLCSNVSISNVCDILFLADRHSDDQLTSTAHDFILNNYNDVLKSNEWESFMCREPLLAVKTVTHFAAKESVVRKQVPKYFPKFFLRPFI